MPEPMPAHLRRIIQPLPGEERFEVEIRAVTNYRWVSSASPKTSAVKASISAPCFQALPWSPAL